MPASPTRTLPLVYACSGCSSVAQLTNACAVRLDRSGRAEMSCISGVGGGVPALTRVARVARSGRPILALDGCPLVCVQACLANAGVVPDQHLVLNRLGAVKRQHGECTEGETRAVWREVESALQRLAGE
ncbi:putative zinc-binding protein [Cupriavidus neocaledonicus]|uniref:Lipoprotein, COG4273 n=1 Tax=Cupriavidus neocaledonicus TaxID=1040979 RepID=A0A375H6Z2_9BURK|nr:putative zinc-binding protein [Cupriavidus neocaledonicus]SOZ37669.1 putative lipoprotein, COG4273 [Cupriavidus neocaledonicus]SPD46243.1 conserved protein of unknown function [Cupriavidus neocaledonicus]